MARHFENVLMTIAVMMGVYVVVVGLGPVKAPAVDCRMVGSQEMTGYYFERVCIVKGLKQ